MITIFDLIAWVETKALPHAMRFEPVVYAHLTTGIMTPAHSAIVHKIADIHSCSLGTAQMIYSTSYGQVQIMGFNLYGVADFGKTVFDYMACDDYQRQTFDKFLKATALDHCTPATLGASHAERLHFAMTYNGSIAYEGPMISALKHFNVAVL
jgi:hypothetical protein